jgi:hypothetical protein
VHVVHEAVKVFTRRGNDWTKRFRKIADDAWHIGAGSAIIGQPKNERRRGDDANGRVDPAVDKYPYRVARHGTRAQLGRY